MYFYQVLPVRKIPQEVLTYFSESEVFIGQLVEVPIQTKLVQALVFKKLTEHEVKNSSFDINHIKPIKNSLPFIFCPQNLEFLKSFARNSFNSLNYSLEAYLQPLELLTKKDWLLINTNRNFLITSNNFSLNFILEINIILRIIYLIRNIQSHKINIKCSNTILIFPEKKYLDKIFQQFEKEIQSYPELKNKISIFKYSGDQNKNSKLSVKSLVLNQNEEIGNSKLKIFFTTRAGIFLPFKNLENIILIDESNSMYIQDQNKVYFDTRDAVFLLAKAFNSNLTYLSTLPSSRLYNFYSEKVLDGFESYHQQLDIKPLKIQITQRNKKSDDLELFSEQVERILKQEDTVSENFEADNFDTFLSNQ